MKPYAIKKFLYDLLPKRKKEILQGMASGAVPDLPDDRDYVSSAAPEGFSSAGDIEITTSPIEDQGSFNSCVGHAISGAVETLTHHSGWPHYFELSRMHVWNEARKLTWGDQWKENRGVYIRDGWKAAQKGITIEKLFPYNTSNATRNLPLGAQIFTGWHEPFDYWWIIGPGPEIDKKVQHLLTTGIPTVFGIALPDRFREAKSDVVFFPKEGEKRVLNHCMMIVGHSTSREAYLVENSWGLGFSWSGRVWISKSYILKEGYSFSYPESTKKRGVSG